jgi:hypothetical protein
MLFIQYWELNEEKKAEEILAAGEALMESGLWPPEGAEILRWDMANDYWGITVFEADSYEAVDQGTELWRIALPGIFNKTRTAVAAPVDQVMGQHAELIEKVPKPE